MNSYTKITLILLLSSLTTLIHTAEKSAAKVAQYHEDNAKTAGKIAETSFTFASTTLWFEMLYKKLDPKNHVPETWKFARRINKPMLAVTTAAFVGASGAWFYNACLAEHHKEEAKKWFWQRS